MKEIKIIFKEDIKKWVLLIDNTPMMQSKKLEQITDSVNNLAKREAIKIQNDIISYNNIKE